MGSTNSKWEVRSRYLGMWYLGHGNTLEHCYFPSKQNNPFSALEFPPEVIDENGNHYPVQSIGHYDNQKQAKENGEKHDYGAAINDKVHGHFNGEYSVFSDLKPGPETVTLPDGLVTISDYAFAQQKTLKTVKIPDTVRRIKRYAFRDCENLQNLVLPPNLREIGPQAFKNCSSLVKLDLPAALRPENIGSSAFDSTGIHSITWPSYPYSNIVTQYVCYGCHNLTEVKLNETVTELGIACFKNCTVLKEICLPDSLKSIDKEAFRGSGLETVAIPDKIRDIQKRVFQDCVYLKSVTLPSKLKNIWENAFRGCTALTSVIFPNTVRSIGESAFRNCRTLSVIHWSDNLGQIHDHAFQGCSSLSELILPRSIQKIGKDAFSDCISLKKIRVCSNTEIDKNAFPDHCSIEFYE